MCSVNWLPLDSIWIVEYFYKGKWHQQLLIRGSREMAEDNAEWMKENLDFTAEKWNVAEYVRKK